MNTPSPAIIVPEPETTAIEQPTTETKPTCVQCRQQFTWRDTAYVPEGARVLCKRCYQHYSKNARERGKFTPASITQERQDGKVVEVPIRSNRAARRGHSHGSVDLSDVPAPKEHRRTRAERRASTRKAKKAAQQVAA